MNYKILRITLALCVILLAPAAAGVLTKGHAPSRTVFAGESEIEEMTVELYINSTGERETMKLEEYVVGVMLAEVPSCYCAEALKAMAVAVRSYSLRRMLAEEKDPIKHLSADLCSDYTHCLGYISRNDACMRWGSDRADAYYKMVEEAVEATKGQVLYYEGCVADAVFHESSAGYTDSAYNVWGIEVPYLISVPTPEEAQAEKVVFSADDFKDRLESGGVFFEGEGEPSRWVEKVELDGKGRTARVFLNGNSVSGRRMQELFSLGSSDFGLRWEENSFVFEVKGKGSGVGLSCEGADCLADNGADYKQILSHYYPGTELSVFSGK